MLRHDLPLRRRRRNLLAPSTPKRAPESQNALARFFLENMRDFWGAVFMDIHEDLRFICESMDANLRYAEGKHISFVAFNGLALFGGFGILRNLSAEASGSYIYIIMHLIMLLLSCALISSIYSFIPIIVKRLKSGDVLPYTNVLFFEHIKHHSAESYTKLLCDVYQVDSKVITHLEHCIISQVIVNARLVSRKFAIFKFAAYFDLAAVVLALCGFLSVTIL
jgi:hypothetical protein